MQWSCRESNPGPNIPAVSFLHVYFCIICREKAGAKQTNLFLSCIVLSNSHSLELQQPVLFLSRRKSVATGLASSTALMDANLSIKQPWHTEYCHLEFSYSYLSANYATHYMLILTKNYAVKTGQPLICEPANLM